MKFKIILILFLLGILFVFWGAFGSLKFNRNSINFQKTVSKQDNVKKTLGEKNANSEGKKSILITKVIDGDTIQTDTGNKVRYIGINTAEKGQPFYNEARKLNEDLVLNKKVNLEFDVQNIDKYGRLLAYVFAGNSDGTNDVFVNLEIIKKGLAVSETIQPNVAHQEEFLIAQKNARENCLGIWKGLCENKKDTLGNKTENCVKIISINANAPGDDNKNKNEEWVEIKNICQKQVSMNGWLLKDSSASNEYRFKNLTLNGQNTIKLHSGCLPDTQTDLYWKCPEIKYAVWNNSADHAFLYNDKAELVSDYQY